MMPRGRAQEARKLVELLCSVGDTSVLPLGSQTHPWQARGDEAVGLSVAIISRN